MSSRLFEAIQVAHPNEFLDEFVVNQQIYSLITHSAMKYIKCFPATISVSADNSSLAAALLPRLHIVLSVQMSHDLVVFVRLNGMDPTAIRISPYATLQSLEVYLPDSVSATFYQDGMELSRSFSLSFCGVTDHSVIDVVARPLETPSVLDIPFEKSSPPPPKVQDKLVDQFYNHVEGTTTSYRKLVGRFLAFGARPGKKRENQGKRTVLPETPDHPAIDELPRPW
jgi:hypothetical protein